ncbi:MAG: glycosyltransferase [Bacteroidetes bacterium]|jgi:UDP-N-acetylglucosamine transferase subunit ALG13|nr:glycosyltransferase [Bacteroidota bacterium]
MKQNFEPIIASDGAALELLRKEFPKLKAIELPSYNISYPKKGSLHGHFVKQLPHFIKTYLKERQHLKAIVAQEQLEGIISDNRFGVWHQDIPSVYITHQLTVLSGFTTYMSTYLHRFIIHKFDECWVPDDENQTYSGILSRTENLKTKVKHLGVISRFTNLQTSPTYDLTIVLSGPEPSRTQLEKILIEQLKNYQGAICFVRGLPLEIATLNPIEGIRFYNYLTARELNLLLSQSKLVLARSGYSTLMDVAVLGKKVFFIPTPGQTEQEYLAQFHQQKRNATYCNQDEFTLEKLFEMDDIKGFSPQKTHIPSNLFDVFK